MNLNWSKIRQTLQVMGFLVLLGVAIYCGIMWVKTTEQGPCTYYPYPCHTHPAGH